MANELRPCPFCGHRDIARVLTVKYCEITCRNCRAEIGRYQVCGEFDDLEEAEEYLGKKATEAWNRRVYND